MLGALIPAAIVSIPAATSASAAPTASPLAHRQVHYTGNRHRHLVDRQWRDRRYTAGRRYGRAPSHYRRYAYRPYNWQSRGCILVGPVWFCA